MADSHLFTITTFNHKRDTYPKVKQLSWQALCLMVMTPVIREVKDGKLLCPATFEPAYRKKGNVVCLSLLGLDCDHCSDIQSVIQKLQDLGLCFVVYSTHSHKRQTPNNPTAEPCYRIIIPLLEPSPANLFDSLWRWAAGVTTNIIDEATKDSSRMFYLPSKHSDSAEYEFYIYEGELLDWRKLNLQPNDEKSPKAKKEAGTARVKAQSSDEVLIITEDKNILELARKKFGKKFERLYSGSAIDYPDPKTGLPDDSRADNAFVVRLCDVGADDEQIERIWKASGRNREKLYSHKTYVPMTIDSAKEWIADQQEVIDISSLEEIEDYDPPISDNPRRESYLRQIPRNKALLSDAYAIFLRLLGFEEKSNIRILTAITQIGRSKTSKFRATTEQLKKKYAGMGKAASLNTVKRDKERLLKEQWRLDVALIGYRSFPYNPESQNSPPSEYQNHLLRKSLEAINLVLTENPQDKYISRKKLEDACKRLLSEFPKPEAKITKRKSSAKPKKTELEKGEAQFIKVTDKVITLAQNAGLSLSDAENWLQSILNARINGRQEGSANIAQNEPYSATQNAPIFPQGNTPDLEVFTI
jgi:hypothetical protein